MFCKRTFCSVKMNDLRLWVFTATLQALLLSASCGNYRRSMTQGGLGSKGGWRPVVGSGGLLYGTFGTSPLHAPHYKIPVPVIDQYTYQSSTRPLLTKDTNKLTSIAQSYRPTTLRTVSGSSAGPAINQPINTYHNPFAFQNNGFSNYKFVQNFPVESVLVRNPHNQYGGRPIYTKYQNKIKQNNQLHNTMLQQLTNIQPIQFGQYPTAKPLDIFGKPIESYARPSEPKKQSSGTEIFKPEVYKLPDSDTAPQSVSQQHVKTAQQQGLGIPNIVNPYSQYSFQDVFPPSILGTFGTFGVQSVKGREPVFQFPTTKTTYLPPQPTKQTIFNSFSYSPNFKTTPTIFDSTTPRLPTTQNQIHFGTTYSDFKITPTPQTKVYVPPKIDPNAGAKNGFKPSPQDPFIKNLQSDYNKVSVTTYNPSVQSTTLANNNFYDYKFPAHQNGQGQQGQVYHEPQNVNFSYEKKKHKIHDSVAAGGNQQPKKQYANAPLNTDLDNFQNAPQRPMYEVTEGTESDVNSQSSPAPWSLTSQAYEYNNQKTTEVSAKHPDYSDSFSKPESAGVTDLPEEFAIVTEAEKGHDNSLSYDNKVESQSRRPLGDDFEPIGKHKLKDYYYKVSTPTYDDYGTSRRTKNPTESAKYTSTQETTTQFNNNNENNSDIQVEALPTLAPNKHFKRPNTPERKRNKIRRRRPPLANINRNKEEIASTSSTRSSTYILSTEATPTTDAEEVNTIRPRVRPTKSQPNLTTPTVTTDFTTSALPTVTPTAPTTIVKKKLAHRRPVTTTVDRPETTTLTLKEEQFKDSQIMKIANRPHYPKLSGFDFKNDFTHKQDEKDTPTSDIAVSISDNLKTTVESEQEFSFHKDVKPIEAKLEPVKTWDTTTEFYREETIDYTTTPRSDVTTTARGQRPRMRNKYNRTRFNVKDYRNRLSSTTTTEKPTENTPKIRFPQRRLPYTENNENESTTERKRFTPKDPRHKINGETSEQTEKEIHSIQPNRQRQTTETVESTTTRVSARIRNGQRRPRPTTEEPIETTNPTTVHSKRPLRKKIKDSEIGESVQDISVTDTTVYDRNEITSERTRSESAIMKIADKKHQDHLEHLFEHSKRVSDLTLAASKDYNKPGMFKTVASNSRRIPNYFTIATDDPILPIEAFFPQLNQKKES